VDIRVYDDGGLSPLRECTVARRQAGFLCEPCRAGWVSTYRLLTNGHERLHRVRGELAAKVGKRDALSGEPRFQPFNPCTT
jgi:hypothetical protein